MSQALLISDNEVVNSLYEVNLKAYVAMNVSIKKNLSGAMELLGHAPNFDAIICFSETINNHKKGDHFISQIQDKLPHIPIIILGQFEGELKNGISIKNKYDIKTLLQSMAKILEISAKEMASMSMPKFFPIPLKLFMQIDRGHCDIYFRNAKDNFEYEYFKILEKDTPIGDSLQKYVSEGVEHLYIDANERLRFINQASKAIVGELNRSDLSDEEKVEITSQGMGIVAEEIFDSEEISAEMAAISKACIESISEVVNAVPKARKLLAMLLENQADYCYKHSVLGTYIAGQIIDHISWGSTEQKEKVAFSFFFHDIYLVPIYKKYPSAVSEEDILFQPEVSDEDKKIVLEHAYKAGLLVKSFPRCPMGADMLITQHHAMVGGKGFAVNYKDDISPLSKVMIIAEEIGTQILIDTKDGQKLNFDKKRMCAQLREKFVNHTYRKIIDAFEASKL